MWELGLAGLAGVATVASPCILPMLPILLGASLGAGSRARPLCIVLGFVATFSATAFAFGASTRVLGISQDALRHGAAVALLGFGGLALFDRAAEWVGERLAPVADLGARWSRAAGPGRLGGLALGAALGALWTPCAGPVLASILVVIATAPDPARAAPLLVAYAAGSGLPMLAIAYGGRAAAARAGRVARHATVLRRGFGALVVASALWLLGERDLPGSAWLAQLLPGPAVARAETLPLLEPVPELAGIELWLNSPPLTLAELRGRVVLIDFWTYACSNCIRTLPHLTRWHERYAADGLVVIGVHSPEFAFEREPDNVRAALRRHAIRYPVALDNRYETWTAWKNRYWPALYLVDREGRLVFTHAGEGDYEEIEHAIRAALSAPR